MDRPQELGAIATTTVLVCAAPLATWWLIGDMTPTRFPPDYYDYLLRTPAPLESATVWLGPLSLLLGLGAAGLLAWLRVPWRWTSAAAAMVGAGVLVGLAARVATAGVVGANIGGGPIVLVLLGAAAALWVSGWRRLRSRRHSG